MINLVLILFSVFTNTKIAASDYFNIAYKNTLDIVRLPSTNTVQGGNIISNASTFFPIQNKVSSSLSSQTVIKVLHIGDSHVKSGFFSEPLMQKLNSYYSQRYQNKLFFNFQWFCKSGTKYSDYNAMVELEVQLKSSQLDLAIISLGTNDAFSGSSKIGFYSKIDHLVKKIKLLSPNTVILITTPPDALRYNAFSRSYVELPELTEVVKTLLKYCVENKIAYWNLHQIMGGNYSMNYYVEKKMAAPDHVHFTSKGYGIFAQWLFEAFTKIII